MWEGTCTTNNAAGDVVEAFETICTRTASRSNGSGQRNKDMYRTEESRVVRRRCRVMAGLGMADYGALR